MYAIIETGGKQYRVQKDDVIDVELLETGKGDKIEFKHVLFFNDGKASKVGAPYVANSTVIGELVGEVKGPKVVSFKYKRRKNYHRKVGHRQKYTRVKIKEIVG